MPAGSSARERAGRALLDEGIARLALLALAERDVQRLLERAVVLIAEVLAVEHVQLFELLPDGSTLVSRASVSGERRMLTRLKLERPADSQASFTLHERAPVIVNDFRRETRFSPSRTQRALEIRTAVSIPLFGRGARPYGVLEIGSRGRLSLPAEAVVDFLQGAGHLVVPAVERARVEAACRFLAESESRIVSAQGFPESVAALAEMAVPRLADWCCIDVVLPAGTIECVAVAHSEPSITPVATKLRALLPPDPTADVGVGHVVRTGVPEFHFDLGAALSIQPGTEGPLADLIAAAGFRAAIVTPLAARGHIFGAVTVIAQSARRLFDEGDVLLASAFAAHAGLALDNVRLFFGTGHQLPALSRIAGVRSGIAVLDPEIMGTQLLSAVVEEKSRLARVVEDVVLASRLSSSDEPPAQGECDAAEAVRLAVETVRSSLGAGWTIELETPQIHTVGDAETIRRIVTCLVDNAARYSPESREVTVRVEVGSAGLRVAVDDNGIGIRPEERGLVFEKFQRGEGARAVAADGVGLGLYLCRELAQRLNGRVGFAERKRGTTVYVELPLAGRDSAVRRARRKGASTARRRTTDP